MSTEAAKKASKKYDQNNTKMLSVKLNKNTDQEILEHMEHIQNKQQYIKNLIRSDILRRLVENDNRS